MTDEHDEHTAIGCAEAVRQLWDLVDGDLAARDRRALDDHLAWCLRCCGELEFLREMQGVLRDRSGGALPTEVQHRLEGFIDTLGEPMTGAES